jgi:hypothetical protein
MTNEQLYTAIGLPIIFNIAFNGMMFLLANRRIDDLTQRFDKRFDDLRDLWRAELHRVEEVLDARLKHLEERP